MFTLVYASILIALSCPVTEAKPREKGVLREYVSSILNPGRVRADRDFQKTVTDILEADYVDPRDAEYIGRHILEHPELYLHARRHERSSPLAKIMARPDLARAFFAAESCNGLLASDMIVASRQGAAAEYRTALADAMFTVVTTDTRALQKRFPDFDVVEEQARALDLARWIGLRDPELIETAFRFLDPALTRFTRESKLGSLRLRANAASDFINRMTREALVPAGRIDELVTLATNLGHPFRQYYWMALVADQVGHPQIERLARAWSSPVLYESERLSIRQTAGGLVARVEAKIRSAPRKFRASP